MAERIIYKTQDEVGFWEAWKKLCAQTNAGPSYTRLNLEWCESISTAWGYLKTDKSFVIMEGAAPLAGAQFFVEEKTEDKNATMSGGYLWAPLSINKDAQKKVFTHLDALAEEFDLGKIQLAIDPLAREPYNFLQTYKYLDTATLEFTISLTEEAVEQVRGFRHGHQSDLKKIFGNKDFSVAVFDSNNPSEEAHELYRALHKKAAGRETRPKSTFDVQFAKQKQGEALLVVVRKENSAVAAAYFDYANGKGVYASGADDPECTGYPLYHLLVYTGMKALFERGVRVLTTCQPSSPSPQFGYYIDKKQENIALFKRGFPGSFVPLYRGVKYYKKEVFENDVDEFKKNYAAYVPK